MSVPLSPAEQTPAAIDAFLARWRGQGRENGQAQPFWLDLLALLGVESPSTFIVFQDPTPIGNSHGFIDAYIPSTHVLVEHKSLGLDLRGTIRQSDGSLLTPFQQARRYAESLSYSQRPRWIVTCNFSEFLVYDMERPNDEPESILLDNLADDLYLLEFIVNPRQTRIIRETEVSVAAGKLIGRIYDGLLDQYGDPSPQNLRWLNILCVRLVFCLYAEDASVFTNNQFHDYLAPIPVHRIRQALIDLFSTLNTKLEERNPHLEDTLLAFPYVNGGLFAEDIDIPQFTPELRDALLDDASLGFDWAKISPTIFGALFESTINPESRRSGGMHYTSVKNIHKVIDPLFLDDLRDELDSIRALRVKGTRDRRLEAFQTKLASLTFLDPACGSGNFLTETYISLRRLENQVLSARLGGQMVHATVNNPVRVSINQFHGIEINDFAVSVATTALWIAESQMLAETARIVRNVPEFLPLKPFANIREGNALRLDWQPEDLTTPFSYIIGNPPFNGARLMSSDQKADLAFVFGPRWRNLGNLDYVSGWYKKALEYMHDAPGTRAALVATNSICQGEAPATLWKPLFADGIVIDFAHRTFRWYSESAGMAHVHCVIIGFSRLPHSPPFALYDGDKKTLVSHINSYLLPIPDIFVESRSSALCDVPPLVFGSMPNDAGHLSNWSPERRAALLERYPATAPFFQRITGSDEYINNVERWCLWLKDIPPARFRAVPPVMDAIAAVRNSRLASKRRATNRLAETPALFGEIRQPESGDYLIVPSVSSERRRYVPMGFLHSDVIASNLALIVPNATLYHFGVLISNIHMAWMRAVCGRLETRYRYSATIVYNNFPWPTPTPTQRARIEATAQAILDARAAHPDNTLADLYDSLSMPADLLAAHHANDRAVRSAYRFSSTLSESDIVAKLLLLYQRLTVQS